MPNLHEPLRRARHFRDTFCHSLSTLCLLHANLTHIPNEVEVLHKNSFRNKDKRQLQTDCLLKTAPIISLSIMARSIPSAPQPPPPPRAFVRNFFTSPLPRWICQRRSTRGGGIVKNNFILSDFKSSIWFHSSMCKYLHNCFKLQTRDQRKKNVHDT